VLVIAAQVFEIRDGNIELPYSGRIDVYVNPAKTMHWKQKKDTYQNPHPAKGKSSALCEKGDLQV
jgi:hypothetical protein